MAPKLKQMSIKHFLSKKADSKNWFDLPFEMREMVIDEMDSKTRCRFAQCSKLCEKEAKSSKNYLYGIEIEGLACDELKLLIKHENWFSNYYFEFINAGNNQTIVEYRSCINEEYMEDNETGVLKWTKSETGKPNNVRIRYFKEYVEKYKHSIRYFCFADEVVSIDQYSIKELRKLEILETDDAEQRYSPDLIECGFADWEQLLNIKRLRVAFRNLYFTFDDILSFTGENANIRSRSLSQEQFHEYLKMRKKGDIHKKLKSITVFVEEPFDVPFIMQGLDVFGYSEKENSLGFFKKEYKFNFPSDANKNGFFRVDYLLRSYISVNWKESAVSDYVFDFLIQELNKYLEAQQMSLELIEERAPIGWFILPLEMREMVIDRMDQKTQCKFEQCSKKCEEETKNSKNYSREIKVPGKWHSELELIVTQQKPWSGNFSFEFISAGGNQTIVKYRSCVDDKPIVGIKSVLFKWTKIEAGKPNDVRVRYFKEYIEKYKKCIRRLELDDESVFIGDYSIKKLRYLETLIIPKVRYGRSGLVESGFIDWNQLLRIKTLDISNCNTPFTFDKIINFTGEYANIRSDSLNQVQVNEYLKMLQKGEVHENLKRIKVHVKESLDISFIMQGLNVFDYAKREVFDKYQFKFRSVTNKTVRVDYFYKQHYMLQLVVSDVTC